MRIEEYIRDIPDFPKPGIVYKDITPLLSNAEAFQLTLSLLVERLSNKKVDKVIGIESRGFIFGAALASHLGVGFVPIRKKGKLPHDTVHREYELEYGTDTLEIHQDAIQEGEKAVIHDDILATGGTAEAALQLVRELGGEVVQLSFIIELSYLEGSKQLTTDLVSSLVSY